MVGMSIDFLNDLERALENGRDIFACPGTGRNQWRLGKSIDELRKDAQRAADSRKMDVQIVRLILKSEATSGDLFLVPTSIDEAGPRGEPNIRWSTVDTKEAAEMMRDVRQGPCPFFAMQVEESFTPTKV
jgi:hypothetical protein